MEAAGKAVQVEGDAVRLAMLGGRTSTSRGKNATSRSSASSAGSLERLGRRVPRLSARPACPVLGGVAEHRADPSMGVLDVEDRVVLRLLGDLGEIEIERRVVLARQHDEADHVLADLVDHVAQA